MKKNVPFPTTTRTSLWALCVVLVTGVAAMDARQAFAQEDRFSAGGYFRVMARPDFDGGWSKLGLWNLSGRLLNEDPWAALELKLDLMRPTPGTKEVWTSLHAKIEGGSVQGADIFNGSLGAFALTQLYVKAGNVLLEDVSWQLGTLHYYYGDLGLYDMRPAEIFFDTVGVSATYSHPYVDVLVGVGDAGYFLRRENYATIWSFGGAVRLRPIDGLELGLGGQFYYEPSAEGNRNAPHHTPLPESVTYEDFVRGRVVETYRREEMGGASIDQVATMFPKPQPEDATSFKAVAYLGFGKLGPLRWNNLFANYLRKHPRNLVREDFLGRTFNIYVKNWTDERFEINLGNEMQLAVIPGWLDVVWGALLGFHFDNDNEIAPSEEDRMIWSTVLRAQVYLSDTVHFLTETSYAQEKSKNGNLWRAGVASIFESSNGSSDLDGIEFGDLDLRKTWQLKTGFVINPGGMGIFSRPSLRLLYGLQHSNMHNAFGNSFVESLDQSNEFFTIEQLSSLKDRNWHQIISIEAEAWF